MSTTSRTQELRGAQTLRITDCRVIPQPFGCLLSACLGNRGRTADSNRATGKVGVADVGGKTKNILSVNRPSEISRETTSVSVGAWDVVRAVRRWLTDNCPNLDLRDHQFVDVAIARQARYCGEPVDLTRVVETEIEPLAHHVLAETTQLRNCGAGLDAVLVSGGGGLLLGSRIEAHFRLPARQGHAALSVNTAAEGPV